MTQTIISGTIDGTWIEGLMMSTETILDRLLTIQEVCELLKVKKTYIYWLTHQRKIPYIKMQGHLRFRQSDIDEWLSSQEVRDAHLQKEV
ncbi:helix-turn-helix domain-containing protein [Candidatus Poribacteria bacterium]